ncbi:MAG: acylphosphatase [Hyphomicrobiaceae bacterium]
MSPPRTLHLHIQGRVQGVWFRESMRIEAERLRVTGWVRNQADGSVEAVVQGSAEAVDALIEWAHRGPPQARVDRIEISECQGQFHGFEKRVD